MREALLRRPPSKPFHALEYVFLLCRGFSAFWPARFSTSSCPIVIFRLTSFRLGRHDRLFFFCHCLLSLSVLSSKERLHISLVLVGNPCKTYQHQSVGKRWNENLLALPQHQHTSFNCPDVSDRIALSFFQGTFEQKFLEKGQGNPVRTKVPLKKDRAILSETSGQLKLVCWS